MNKSELEDFRSWLNGILKTGPVTVTFEKKDGSIRVMKCTLNARLVPLSEKKSDKVRKQSLEVLNVYDLELNDWRSFTIDNVKSIKFDLDDHIVDSE